MDDNMEEEKTKEPEKKEEDRRLMFIANYLFKSLRLKPDKWTKMLTIEEYAELLANFLNQAHHKVLIMMLATTGHLIPAAGFPTSIKTKTAYFIKKDLEDITTVNIQQKLLLGDLSPQPIDDLSILVEEVFLPILSNKNNHRNWPKVLSDDMVTNVHQLHNVICEVRGKINGQTLLAMPLGIEHVHKVEQDIIASNGEFFDVRIKSSIQSAVMKWFTQVNDIINEESRLGVYSLENPTPMDEILFWEKRLKNIESIYYQLRDPKVKKMASILELTHSPYYSAYGTMFKGVVAALAEAREINIYLKPLQKHIEKLESAEIIEAKSLLVPMMHVVCLIWANSYYYRTSTKMVVLLKAICNLLIQQTIKFLDPNAIFQREVNECLFDMKACIKVLNEFRNIFETSKSNIHTYFKGDQPPVQWSFEPEMAFDRMTAFLGRLHSICTLFTATEEFLRLEKIEIGGIKGRSLTAQVSVIFQEFSEVYGIFSNVTYNPLDPEDPGFMNDFQVFQEKVKDFDCRLIHIFTQAFDDSYNLTSLFKCAQVISAVSHRPEIHTGIYDKYKMILGLLDKELDNVKKLYSEQILTSNKFGHMVVDTYFPPMAGALMWIMKLKKRIVWPMNNFLVMDEWDSKEGKRIVEKYKQMIHQLDALQKSVLKLWSTKVPSVCRENLSKRLMICHKDRTLTLNFDKQLVAILREVRCLKYVDEVDIPPEAKELYSRRDTLRSWICDLNIIIDKYNSMLRDSMEVLLNLITDEMKQIDELIDHMQSTLNWTSCDADMLISKVKEMVCKLRTRLANAESNTEQVRILANKWSEVSLYARKDKKKNTLVYLGDRAECLQKRYNEVVNVSKEIQCLIEDTYNLFHDISIVKDCRKWKELRSQKSTNEKESFNDSDKLENEKVENREECTECKEKGKLNEIKEQSDKEIEEHSQVEETSVKRSINDVNNASGLIIHQEGKNEKQLTDSEKKLSDDLQKIKDAKKEKWQSYIQYMDSVVSDGLYNAILFSLGFFLDEMDPIVKHAPLFEIELRLVHPNITFYPSLNKEDSEGFYSLVNSLLKDIMKMSSLIARVDKNSAEQDYEGVMMLHRTLVEMRADILSRVEIAMNKTKTQCKVYEKYSYLWLDCRKDYFNQFVKYSRLLTVEEMELAEKERKTGTPSGIEEVHPTNDMFKEKIDHYNDLYYEVEKLEENIVLHNWLQVNIRPLKQAILNEIRKWINMFTQYLVNHVLDSLNELEVFIDNADKGMTEPVPEGDYNGLIKVMGYLYHIKERQTITDGMFEPLKAIIDLLKPYDVEFPEEVYLQLQDLPEKWESTKKISVTVRQNVAPLMAAEVSLIRRRLVVFDIMQNQFREYFRKQAFFRYDCQGEDVYELLDNVQNEIVDMEEQMNSVLEQASLFEVTIPEFKHLSTCRKEIRMLKQLWDYIIIIESSIDEWKKTPWRKIDVEGMDMECKKFGKDIRSLDKEVRVWDAYLSLESTIKNLLTSLRAVTELQNPAIRERHWQQLMKATKVSFVMDEKTTLSDLLALNLHNYEDEVKDIVDKSVKEMSMEKVLKELDNVWSSMVFEHETHARTGVTLLKVSEELIEMLEENQVQLQNLLGSRYIAFFLEQVSDWQKKLANADQTIQLWFEVQRTWMHLESIFIGSEDIRKQLPEDSKRFDKIDHDFQEILQEMLQTPNIVGATNKPMVYERMERIQRDLTLCEKALAEYLETKRLAYPRFYFVSSVDLLDILSKGNQPELVARHLTKLYDSMAKLRFKFDNKSADAMWSKDGEFVNFFGVCECTGKVEVWLNRLTNIMRHTIRMYFEEAVESYEEKPREIWIFDYPAQVSLCGTQIWWTTEVNIAFARLDEGYEYALKDYQKKQVQQLNVLIALLLGDLSAGDRQKIMTICTIDVHSRDVVAKMMQMKVASSSAFQWQCQLRHRWDEDLKHCFCNICDAQFQYAYEYLGNTPRLVITPLTDRCYITLTQSLHLVMGGAPAGPAGTGKTETTKDLGRAMGVMVYVFNCSEQMDYKSCGNMYKGLAQTGAWGCCDEFNRISVEVLSVVSVQVKAVLDAIKTKKKKFYFMGEQISLEPTVGMFITMNPGYAGRTELPENLKALFRPCAMVVPDFELICEIMLVAEGFQDAKLLARKFITLYTLCRELLSKQDHYDWGLRAIKSVLVVAGALKRGDRSRPEEQVLMRALRDFNIPKIVTDDLPVFMGLIGDLFPALDVPRKRDMDFEKVVKQSVVDLVLQPEDNFILKVVQLEELLEVRHSVFIVGNAGTGKTMVWRSLFKTYQNQKRKPVYNDLNPKSVTNDELFGIINPATREWKDGLISMILRDQANMSSDCPKWIVLDGDIDPMWIESLNTVMDDNKVLTLASNERIALTKSMRLLFEIASLRTATPATVSRAGILYINPQDLGWNPFVTSWIDKRPQQSERASLIILFDKYIPPCLDSMRSGRFKRITPIAEISYVEMLCKLLDCLLTPSSVPQECPKEWYEIYFVFACVWSFGSAIFQDQLIDYRIEFSKWWVGEFKVIKFPPKGTVFDYYIDSKTKQFLPWTDLVEPFTLNYDIPLQSSLVPTTETTRLRFFIDLLMGVKHPVMLVGNAGTGKSVIINDKLSSLSENYAITNVPLNFYTTSEMLQKVLEKPLEKKAGRNYGPPGNKTLVYFIDDLNMPEVDRYGTVQPHTLIRQYFDYGHWYDRSKLTLKDIHNCQVVSCMNPTSGSFTINPRLQRHFSVFAVCFPSEQPLTHIYQTILCEHLNNPQIKSLSSVENVCKKIVDVALKFHDRVSHIFLPTAIKFHYIFNLRDLSNIFQGMLFADASCVQSQWDILRLWMHEANRVYGDKLVDSDDAENFQKALSDCIKKAFEDLDENMVFQKPLIYCHFAEGIGETKYMPIRNWDQLHKLLLDAMSQYNDLISAMNLVLFEDAMLHVCRISRILESPRGNALLVGVGGSGKQSLARLASFICSLEVFQLQLTKAYSMADLKNDLAQLYLKSGLKSVGNVFLMTDAQVSEEIFLVLINDMLASGEIPDLFPDEEVENIVSGLRNEVKATGMLDSKDNCWKFFIDRARRQLKIVLCFSPVGATLRVRGRKFPALVNCTAIDWFHQWPQSALESVSTKFLEDLSVLPRGFIHSVSLFMAFVHASVNEMSEVYYQNERRYNYTTPKSFLEQISLYSKLLTDKTEEVTARILRLENGLQRIHSAGDEIEGMKIVLAAQQIEVNERNKSAAKLIDVLAVETENVTKEKAIAAAEEAKVRVIEEDVSMKQKICEEDLAKAEPALVAAMEALNTLNKANLTELKSFGSPPAPVVNVVAAVMILFSPKGKIPKDLSWKACKLFMGKVDQFLSNLITYDKENIPTNVYTKVQEYIKNSNFSPDVVITQSFAAAGLCAWVINIVKFYDVYLVVEPKRRALNQANEDLSLARQKLCFLNDKITSLEEQLDALTKEYEAAVEAKLKCQEEADKTALTIDIANRLVSGLTSENIRWSENVVDLKKFEVTLPGDILLLTAFVSYAGCFTRKYRLELMNNRWLPHLKKLKPMIPTTEALDILTLLTDDAQIATWNNEGLPNDRMSTENATILVNSSRWPLMIDPQLQGVKWIKSRYKESLKIIRLGQKSYLDVIEMAVSEGNVVLVENISETVDAVLDPLLSRALIKKGTAIKIGDKEVDFNPKFRLILHTKLGNPHYKPEMQAQTTLINFTVTRDGLEDQLLAEVVKAECPDLENKKSELTRQQNDFKITLKMLEDDLLHRLAAAGENILSDLTLVTNLETTKKTAAEIQVKVAEAKVMSIEIDAAREKYRPAAARASLLYFILNDLYKINPIYQFSLKAFSTVFQKSILSATQDEDQQKRVNNLLDSITFSVYLYTSRGLFERDKLIFLVQMAFQILLNNDKIKVTELDFLLRFPTVPNVISPVDFLSNVSWGGVKSLSLMDDFRNLDRDIESSPKRWKALVDSECPEEEKLPQEWKNKTSLQQLCILRTLRPDRMTYAMRKFVEEKLGSKYTHARSIEFAKSYEETSPSTPVFFILSPGVDPLKDVEKHGQKLGFTLEKENIHNVSLGQGQEVVAENAMDVASTNGHWVILQNVHLVKKWLNVLEKKIEQCSEISHKNYRLFMSAEPAADPESHIIPQGILESSIKITNEPPTGMKANLHKALDNFNQETLEMCTKESEFKSILFALCYFHAVVAERRKFGAQGWNRVYPFNNGDLTISVNVLYNYLENSSRVPWEDLRYLFGEIMYGGHITDDWDRRLCRTYLEEYMRPELVDTDLNFAPGFHSPPNLEYTGYHDYITQYLPLESPYLYGLHPNAEIGFLTTTSDSLFRTVFEMQPRDVTETGASTVTREEKIKQTMDEIIDKIPEPFNMLEIMAKVEERTPYIVVAFQECERMNILTTEMKRSLKELELGLKGELTITLDMEKLQDCLFLDTVPENWTARAYPSLLTLGPWCADLALRIKELEMWSTDFALPTTVWLSGFFNPQSFLTAIMQSTARKNEWPLDKMCVACDVTRKYKEEYTAPPREGAYIHGLSMEGARWDIKSGVITDSRLKELFPLMPVLWVRAITQDKQDLRNIYECPVYKTRIRGPTYVWTFNLKSKDKPAKWTLAGVALLLQI